MTEKAPNPDFESPAEAKFWQAIGDHEFLEFEASHPVDMPIEELMALWALQKASFGEVPSDAAS